MSSNPALRLLPHYFRKVGLTLALLTVLFFFALVITRPVFPQGTKELVKLVLTSLLIVALALVALSRERVEDERVQALRLQAFAFSFICTLVYTLVDPFVQMLLDGSTTIEKVGSQHAGLNMILVYLLFFTGMKRARR